MDGRIDVAAARVVTKASFPEFGAEYAVLKIDRSLDRPCKLAHGGASGIVYAVGAHGWFGLEYIAGSVRSTKVLSAEGQGGTLVISDIPMWHGDSGGPLFASNGRLIGINTAVHYEFSKWRMHYDRYSFAPDANDVESQIDRDRTQYKKANQAPLPTPVSVTPAAGAPVAPATGAAEL
jgi:hypothetical protein